MAVFGRFVQVRTVRADRDLHLPGGAAGADALLRIVLVLFLYVPIAVLAVFSFNAGDVSFFPSGGVHARLVSAISSRTRSFMVAFERSAIVAAISSLIAVGLGVAASFALLRRRFFGKPAVSALLFSPLVVPYLVFGISLLVIFTAVDKFLTSATGSYLGLGLHAVVIGHVVVSIPSTRCSRSCRCWSD